MTKPDEQSVKDAMTRRQEAKAAERAKMLERARRTGRKTVLSRLSTKAAKASSFLGMS